MQTDRIIHLQRKEVVSWKREISPKEAQGRGKGKARKSSANGSSGKQKRCALFSFFSLFQHFRLFVEKKKTDYRPMDEWTDGATDNSSYRDTSTHLKIRRKADS